MLTSRLSAFSGTASRWLRSISALEVLAVSRSFQKMLGLMELFTRYRSAKTEAEASEAGRAIVDLIGPRLGALMSKLTSEEVAKDLLQDVWTGLFSGLHQFRGNSDGQAAALCRVIVERRAADWIRRRPKGEMLPLDVEEIRDAVEASLPVKPFSMGERLDVEEAMKLIKACKPENVWFIEQLFFEQRSYKEIGQLRGMTEAAVAMKIRRILEAAKASVPKRQSYV